MILIQSPTIKYHKPDKHVLEEVIIKRNITNQNKKNK